MLVEQEERLEAKEEAFTQQLQVTETEWLAHRMQKLEESFDKQQSARIPLEAASKWEEHILTKSDEVMLGIETRHTNTYSRVCGRPR